MKGAIALLALVLQLFIVMPIWFYILYQILTAIKATDLVWFLYWIYIPVALITAAIANILKQLGDD